MRKNSRKFFKNDGCEHFPCHAGLDAADFNCIFCYCPLYGLGDQCGGAFAYTARKIKACTNCHLPHLPEYYDVIVAKLKEASAQTD